MSFNRTKEAFDKFLQVVPSGSTVLDLGSGGSQHANIMREKGFCVTTLDAHDETADIQKFYPLANLDQQFNAIWCSHVLEHQANPGRFLRGMALNIVLGGWLCLSVPQMKSTLKSGHLQQYTVGGLLYNLIVAGFDCRDARVLSGGSNISVLVQYRKADLPVLSTGVEDLERLAKFFPVSVTQGCNANFGSINW